MSPLKLKQWKHRLIRIIVGQLNKIKESEYEVILIKKHDRQKLKIVTLCDGIHLIQPLNLQ